MLLVRHEHFVVHAAAEIPVAAGEQRFEEAEVATGLHQPGHQIAGNTGGSESVHDQVHLNAARGSAHQCFTDACTGAVVREYVHLQMHALMCAVDQRHHPVEVRAARSDQGGTVALRVAGMRAGAHVRTRFRRFTHLYTSNHNTEPSPIPAAMPSCAAESEARRKKSRKNGT